MPYSGKIEETSSKLNALGWALNFHNWKIQQFSMHVDYDSKQLTINCPKAYHASLMLDHVLDIVNVEQESLSNQKCRVSGAYVYYFIGLEVFTYEEPTHTDHPSFRNLVLTGMPLVMFSGEFMPNLTLDEPTELPEQTDRSVMHIEVEGDVSIQTAGDITAAVQNAKLEM